MADVRKLVRSALVFVPFTQDARFALGRWWQRWGWRPVEPDLLALPRLGLPPDALLLDVGANRGLVLELMVRLMPRARVIAFEPNPRLAAWLTARWRGDPRVEVRPVALADRAGAATLWLPVYRNSPFDGLASLDPEAARGWLSARRLYGFRPDRLRLEPLPCETVRIDDLELAPAFVKLDVQGLEAAVLRGGEATLRRHRPILLVEAGEAEAVRTVLEPLDYEPAAFVEGRLVAAPSRTVNTFFLPRERAGQLLAAAAPD
jgi:FkbM family methyltransferase